VAAAAAAEVEGVVEVGEVEVEEVEEAAGVEEGVVGAAAVR
jgi:hypothetical protein